MSTLASAPIASGAHDNDWLEIEPVSSPTDFVNVMTVLSQYWFQTVSLPN